MLYIFINEEQITGFGSKVLHRIGWDIFEREDHLAETFLHFHARHFCSTWKLMDLLKLKYSFNNFLCLNFNIWLLNLIYLSFLDFFVTWRNHSWWPWIGRSSVTLPVKRLIRGVFGIFVLRGLGSAFSKNFRKILGASCLKNEFPDIEHVPNYSSSLVVKMFKLKYLSALVFQLKLRQVYPTTKFAMSDIS